MYNFVSAETTNSKYVELVQKKLSSLEEENSQLRSDLTQLHEQTEQLEQHEQRLTTDCVHQLSMFLTKYLALGYSA